MGYIENCLKSVCGQTFANLDIIVVNDGSVDQTMEICQKYASIDSRIRIFTIENSGVSYARNYGLNHAKGEYVQFVDADDILVQNGTEIFLKILRKYNVDLVVCNYTRVLSEIRIPFNQLERRGYYTNKEYVCNTLKDPGHHYYGVVWNKFYRKSIIDTYQIRFSNEVSLGEDFIFNLHYLVHAKSVQVIRYRLYDYNCVNRNTLSRYEKNIQMCKKELHNRHLIFKEYKKTFENLGLYEKYKKRVQQYWLIYLAMNLYYIKYVFKNWEIEDISEWSKILESCAEITKCKETVSSFRLKGMVCRIWVHRTFAEDMKSVLRTINRSERKSYKK